MELRQENTAKRYGVGPTKARAIRTDWDAMPSWTLLQRRDVCHVTGLSPSALNARLKEGSFPMYVRHGKDRVWQLSAVREWCEAVARGEVKETYRPHPKDFRAYYAQQAAQAEGGSDHGA
jgi:predicted DNA-binding transcriptional regulator AlpA